MKRLFYFMVLFTLFSFIVVGQGILKSHHDFTGAFWNGDQSCKPCHYADVSVKDSLAGLAFKRGKGFASFSKGFQNEYLGQPLGKSKLCLSCHDGTVAEERHVNYRSSFKLTPLGYANVDLHDEHPISIAYNTSRSYLNDPATTNSGLGGSIARDLLENGKIECTSCHDVHLSRSKEGCKSCHGQDVLNKKGIVSVSLWKNNTYSALCLTCHRK